MEQNQTTNNPESETNQSPIDNNNEPMANSTSNSLSTPDQTTPERKMKPSLFFAGVAVLVLIVAGVAYMQLANDKANADADNNPNITLTPEEAAEPVAYVNGIAVTRGDLAESITQVTQNALQSGVDINDLVVKSQIETQAYDVIINNELLKQAASESVERPSDEAVQAEIDTLVTQNGGEEAFAELLTEFGLTEETLKTNIADNLHIQAYLDTKITEVEIDDQQVLEYYERLGGEAAGLPPLEEVETQIEQQLKLEAEQNQVSDIIEELRNEAEINKV
ncbi:SurA N-terminal domain-containing protein [Candidatus Kaiserbacteria bacterium]|nr:SurA N-terminal domain-containing protein [Candidatus Kaiserbacteria bacterium]